jgi:translation initiation factor 4B
MQVKSVKIIKSKDEKPKGFGYIEFEDIDGLKDALLKTGSVRPLLLTEKAY